MLEKNKDYVEFTLKCTTVDYGKNKGYTEVCLNGYSDAGFPCVPMDVVCKEFDHKVVVVGKRGFDELQALVTINAAFAKEWEEKYNLLFKKTGFDTTEELVFYLTNVVKCDTIQEAIANLQDKLQCARDEWKDMKKKLEECEKDYISERDKAEAAKTENKQLKKKLEEFSPAPLVSVNGWEESAKFWKKRYDDIFKLVGFSSKEEVEDYLVNEAECDTLHETILKLIDENKYACEEWCKANSSNNSWKAAAECNSPKELIEKRETLEGKVKVLETEAEVYSRTLQEWKEVTGYPSPSAVKTALESGASWCHAYNEVKKANEKLADDVKSWKNVTGYSTPEGFLAARINAAIPFDYTAVWQKATGCTTPEQAKERIKALNERINELEADYNHLLCTTGFESEGEIEDALDKCDHSTLRKALVDYEFDYENLLKLTGYKSEHDIRVLLNDSEQFVYENMRELINSLKRKAKFTDSNWQVATRCETPEAAGRVIESLKEALRASNLAMQKELDQEIDNWQKATGCNTPEIAKEKLEHYKSRLSNAVQAASCASKHLDTITF